MILVVAVMLAQGTAAQQGAGNAVTDEVVTAKLSGHGISGLVSRNPSGGSFKHGIALFPGYPGIMRLMAEGGQIKFQQGGNFLVRSRRYWLDDATLTLAIDAPDDQWGSFAQHFRATPRYGADVAGLLDAVEAKFGKLEWTFVGTSEGSVSAFHAARMLPGRAARVILTSSLFVPGRNGPGLSDADWPALKAPLLWVHHRDDPCRFTPYAEAEKLAKLTHAPLVTVQGGSPGEGDACEARSAHGFIGIEREVVDAMHEWVRTGSAPPRVAD